MVELGKTFEDKQERDAVHVAIAPCIAGVLLWPGVPVKFKPGSTTIVVHADRPEIGIGIVDPFLTVAIREGQGFWVLLYPNTVTSLRHEWTHPAFDSPQIEVESKPFKSEAKEWLKAYASEVNMAYDDLIEAAEAYLDHGETHCVGFDTPNIVYAEREKFWLCYETVTQKTVADSYRQGTFIHCAC